MSTEAWVRLEQGRYPGVKVRVADVDGRMTITGIEVLRSEGVTLDDLRSIPIPRLEAAWNDQADRAGMLVRQRVRLAGTRGEAGVAPAMPKMPTKRELRLAIPTGRRYPDGFYQRVASLYLALVANGIRPGPAISEANPPVPVSTVHRWIKEARARGFLARARQGGGTG